ncbi:hypothetical protein Stsp02_20210 [Streptomyces sp. NBRC 14336]|uniref:Uncharacterized protein n=1 Tax=Streptomyces thermocarboxydovorans TaxID=59298 RepID=A0ABP3SKT7_9ACTN|nr:hypothetical protein Stsp02_20210 [Streptomyces sp. NBRC 14336]
MSYRAGTGRGAVGRLMLLLLLALGLMHLLAHTGDAGRSRAPETAAHAHAVQHEPTPGEAAKAVATASDQHDHHGTEGATEFGVCAAVIGCCALLAAGSWRLRGRRAALLLLLRRHKRPAWPGLCRPSGPTRLQGVDIAQLAVLRI